MRETQNFLFTCFIYNSFQHQPFLSQYTEDSSATILSSISFQTHLARFAKFLQPKKQIILKYVSQTFISL